MKKSFPWRLVKPLIEVLIVLAILAILVSFVNSLKGPVDHKDSPPPSGLYTDEEIRKLANYDIDKESGGDMYILNVPCLDVVPSGSSFPRSEVFKELNIDDTRIRDFRWNPSGHIVFLIWQVSPSYDINCMSVGAWERADAKSSLDYNDPRREVYGIRLVKRSK